MKATEEIDVEQLGTTLPALEPCTSVPPHSAISTNCQCRLCILRMATTFNLTSHPTNQYVTPPLPFPHTNPPSSHSHTVFIYSCPSSSPIKHRMLYSSGASGVFASAKSIITAASSSASVLASRKIETSDPKELDEAYLRAELGIGAGGAGGSVPGSAPGSGAGTPSLRDEDKKPFARPKGPGRRR